LMLYCSTSASIFHELFGVSSRIIREGKSVIPVWYSRV